MDLTTLDNNVATMSSLEIADLTGKRHSDVMRDIRNILEEAEISARKFARSYLSAQNKELPCYRLPRLECDLIVSGYAVKYRLAIIKRWHELEAKQARHQDSLEWKQARLGGKQVRRSVTDAIKEFVDYATEQGSRNAHMYYMAVTRMEYKALGLLRESDGNFRDTMTITQLSFLSTAENLAKIAIQQGMDHELHYKQIYELAKNRVMAFAKSVEWAKLNDINADQRKLK